MKVSRRRAISLLAGAPGILGSRKSFAYELLKGVRDGHPETQSAGAVQLDIAPGPFKGTRESLREWQVPDWYRDAKFGIWAHWGPSPASKMATGTPATCMCKAASSMSIT